MTRDPADEHSADPTTLPQSGRLLALDVGDRRIGLAVSIPPGSLILPAGHIRRRNRRADIAAILDAANARDAVAIIVGIPYDAQGRAGEQGRKIQSLVRALERATDIPILTVDESTLAAGSVPASNLGCARQTCDPADLSGNSCARRSSFAVCATRGVSSSAHFRTATPGRWYMSDPRKCLQPTNANGGNPQMDCGRP